ncbi:DUF559 domain-containing protein [Pseudonocardia sp. HH130630-07]|uniref:DUF559 domain-containing protein n=1 Tax=Pseudonocardia sp. HH130630-07 TaxID=1690815 RepID=UPI000814CEBA|nr:DUF559 domain-containing protein [Pseudonocardia sp. HH130630-07]ANY05517.1 hypothetical protein AFB00_03475 [Pseudonocardia sp. HH130630-07]
MHVLAGTEPTYLQLCEAAALAVGARHRAGAEPVITRGVLAGWSAAEMLGADCAPRGVPAEVLVPGGSRRVQEGLRVHRGGVRPDEVAGGVRIPVPGSRHRFVPGHTVLVTTALRTAFDLARREERDPAVVALDALARVGGFAPDAVLGLAARHPGVRGVRRLAAVVALADPLAESPMESRTRLALHDGGLPAPVSQYPVGPYRIDLAYPRFRLGIEYDGRHHLTPSRARADLERQQYLSVRGWHILRPEAPEVLHRPAHLAGRVRYLIERHAAAPA